MRLRCLVGPRSTNAAFSQSSSGSTAMFAFSAASLALAIADLTSFPIPSGARLLEKRRIARAWLTFLPRIMSITRRAFWADPRRYFALALASIFLYRFYGPYWTYIFSLTCRRRR